MCRSGSNNLFRSVFAPVSVLAAIAALATTFMAAGPSHAQSIVDTAKPKPPFGEMKLHPGTLSFKAINLATATTSETKSFVLTNSGNSTITIAVGGIAQSGSAFHYSGLTTLTAPSKVSLSVTIDFAPPSAGKYGGTMTFTVSAANGATLKGKASVTAKLAGSAKGAPVGPTPTSTPTPSPTPATPTATPTPGSGSVSLSGTVDGGTAPICGSDVTLYAAGTSGYGAGASAVAADLTSSAGSFSLSFNCPSASAQMYAVATGGTANNSCRGSNSAVGLVAALGPCASMPSVIVINEATTVASVWSLQRFMDTTGATVGTSSTNATGLANAMIGVTSHNLIEVTTGLVPSSFAAGLTSPTSTLYTIADLLAPCAGATSSNASACSSLFNDAKPAGGTAPSTTLEAALDIALHPANNVSALFGLVGGSPPFTPALSSAPGSWVLGLNFQPPAADFSSEAFQTAVDSHGNVWAPQEDNPNSVSELVAASGYTGANFAPSVPSGICCLADLVIDLSDNLWTANNHDVWEMLSSNYSNSDEFSPSGWTGALNEYGGTLALDTAGNLWLAGVFTSNGDLELPAPDYTSLNTYDNAAADFNGPDYIGVDPSGNIWSLNGGSSPSLSELVAPNYSSGGANFPVTGSTGVGNFAIDASGNVFVVNRSGDNVLERLASSGQWVTIDPSGANLGTGSPWEMFLDAAENIWLVDFDGGVSEITASGNYASGFYFNPPNAGLSAPGNGAVDASGNIWIVTSTGSGTYSEGELIGVAAPTITPLEGCLVKEATTHGGCVP
jgi:hypothetical protein